MAVAKLNKKEIDEKVLEFLKIDQDIKDLVKRKEELKNILEAQYTLSADQKETIKGIQTEFEKIPVNQGRNSYNTDLLKPFLKAIGSLRKVIKTVIIKTEQVDTKVLNQLVKDGLLPSEVLDKCREDKWTFKSDFRRIEKVAQSPAPAVEKAGNKRKVQKIGDVV